MISNKRLARTACRNRRRFLFGNLLAEGQPHLLVLFRLLQLLEQQTWLNVLVVLVLATATVLADLSLERVVENLANRQAGVDADWMDCKQLKRPVTAEADIAEACRHMNEQPQPTD